MEKEKEIKLLRQLCEEDTYFADFFRNELQQMIRNIENDFPITFETQFYLKADLLSTEIREQREGHEKRLMKLCEDLLYMKDNPDFSVSELDQFVNDTLGQEKAISIKLKNKMPLTESDYDYLSNHFYGLHRDKPI